MKQIKSKFIIIGFLTFCGATNAQIIYTDINPDCESTMTTTFGGIGDDSNLCAIDFDNNGSIEYSFRWDIIFDNWYMHMSYGTTDCEISLNGTTDVNGGRIVEPLQLNDVIDNSLTWGISFPEPFIGVQQDPESNNNFLNLGDRYVGVKFRIGANTHYGWVLINFQTVGSSRKIIVKAYAYNSAPNAQILAGQTSVLTTPSNAVEPNQIRIYPIPTNENIYIDGMNVNRFQYNIVNTIGQIVCLEESYSNKINLDDLPNGIYTLNIITADGINLWKKIIKQ